MLKLNLGCGANKLEGYTNVDIDKSLEPDLVCDFTQKLPFESGTVDRIVMFHVIEHIQKVKHRGVLLECRRVLKPEGELVISFPEFSKVAQNWLDNKHGLRGFWEATLYGRQLSPSDFHVCIMDSTEFTHVLTTSGFAVAKCVPESSENYNTVIKAVPDLIYTYAGELLETVWTEQHLLQKS